MRVRLKPDTTGIAAVRLKPDTTEVATVRLPAFALRASARSRRRSAAIVRSGGGKPDTTDIATSSAHTSALFDADLAGDVRAAVVVVFEAVAQVELPDGERHGEVDLEVGRQPHVRKRLADRHCRLEIADVHEPLGGEKVEADVVERVLDDLVCVRLDPQRDERDLVHQAPEFRVARLVVGGRLLPVPPAIGAAEHPGREVLDAQHVATVERLAADERVLPFLELEPQKIGGGDELRLPRLPNQSVEVSHVAGRRRFWSVRRTSGLNGYPTLRIHHNGTSSGALVALLRSSQV